MRRPSQRVPFEDVERQLVRIFRALLFNPLIAIIKAAAPGSKPSIENAPDDALRDAIRVGQVQYHDGVFSGSFSAAIGVSLKRMGARFDKPQGVYRLESTLCPPWVRSEALMFQSRAHAVHLSLSQRLDQMQRDLDAAVDAYDIDPTKMIAGVNDGFKEVARELEIMPTLSTDAHARLAADYNANMKLWIKKFSAEEIENLRGVVEKNALQGYRFKGLVDDIEHRYAVSKSKANFLARQETSLFMSKFRKQRYGDAGITSYTWSTSHDERVRDRHRHLDGKVFQYADPPIVDEATGRRGNPGEDFNCRCVDIPVLVRK